MLTVLKILGILVGIKLIFDVVRYAIIETYYMRRGWESGTCTYGVDENGVMLSTVPNKLVKLLMDSRGWEYILGWRIGKMCSRLTHIKREA